MRLATVAQSQEVDRRSQSEFELPSELLMESAGCLAARECLQSFVPEAQTGRIALLCGPGGNGADGMVMARHLLSQLQVQTSAQREKAASVTCSRVTVFLLAPEAKRSKLFLTQLRRLQLLGAHIISVDDVKPVYDSIAKCWTLSVDSEARSLGVSSMIRLSDHAIWIDALFGVGFKGSLDPHAALWVQAINGTSAKRVSLDTPSGLDADRGVATGTCFRGDRTITFGCAKTGFTVNEGPAHVGHVKVLGIGFPAQLIQECMNTHHLVTRTMARKLKPKRISSSNKTKSGHSVIFAGHQGMWGAGVLASTAAYRIGSGYVSLVSHDDPAAVVNQHPEILTQTSSDKILWEDKKWKAAGIGPGLGTTTETRELILKLKTRAESGDLTSLVLDADAITVASRDRLFPLPANWILTPHAGELARILISDSAFAEKYENASELSRAIENDRFHYASEAAKITGCWILLKGFRTVITHAARKKFWVIGSGNAALAKAGTGDVLTGFITGLLSQGLSPLRAACLGAFVHGLIADEWLQSGGDILSLESSDLIRRIPDVLSRL